MSKLYTYVYRYLCLVLLSLTLLVGGSYGKGLHSSNQKAKKLNEIIKPDQTIQTALKGITSNNKSNKMDSFKRFGITSQSLNRQAYLKLFNKMESRLGDKQKLIKQLLYFGAKQNTEEIMYTSAFIHKFSNVSESDILNCVVPLLGYHNVRLNEVINEVLEVMSYDSKKEDWDFTYFKDYISKNIKEEETVLLLKLMFDFDRREAFRVAMSTFGKRLENNKYKTIRTLHQDIEEVLKRIRDLQRKMTSNRRPNQKQKHNKQDIQKNLTKANNDLKNKIHALMRYPYVWIEWYILQVLKNHHDIHDQEWVEDIKNEISD